jgi:NTE family protein
LAAGEPCPTAPAADAGDTPVRDLGAVRRLVFEGGGVKGVAYVGALDVLAERGVLERIEAVGGASVGSITALLLAVGYSPAEIESVLLGLDFARFKDGTDVVGDLRRLERELGWFEGQTVRCFLDCAVAAKLCDPAAGGACRPTFADLRTRVAAGGPFRDLRVVATDAAAHESVVFAFETTPDVALADAVRMSMSIPLYFVPPRHDGRLMIDGGVVRNYPIDLFDDLGPPAATLGLHLGAASKPRPIEHMRVMVEELLLSLVKAQVDALCHRPQDLERTLFIDPEGVSGTDFELDRVEKCRLVDSGRRHALAFLAAPPARSCPAFARGGATPKPSVAAEGSDPP